MMKYASGAVGSGVWRQQLLRWMLRLNLIFGLFLTCSMVAQAESKLQGLYTHHLEDSAQLVVPRKVNHRGEFLSHRLVHHHHQQQQQHLDRQRPNDGQHSLDYDSQQDWDQNRIVEDLDNIYGRRVKRSASADNAGEELADPKKLHYHVDVGDQTLHLELEPSTESFVAPLMVVERHRRDLRTRSRSKKHIHSCHYQGHIRGHDQSRVALSACQNGLDPFFFVSYEVCCSEDEKHVQLRPVIAEKAPLVLFTEATDCP
ncbi:uncharacterized protein LOC129753778 [Uranotaenia lowii]|uniref:uncharacterized protein LOC129753778 n=1 Tax=Uranotaenia lowii TaxID=190385 RepID=UPI0024791852|nr:uncharacterized protein LOC129753778 [Uranotaenia lowii]